MLQHEAFIKNLRVCVIRQWVPFFKVCFTTAPTCIFDYIVKAGCFFCVSMDTISESWQNDAFWWSHVGMSLGPRSIIPGVTYFKMHYCPHTVSSSVHPLPERSCLFKAILLKVKRLVCTDWPALTSQSRHHPPRFHSSSVSVFLRRCPSIADFIVGTSKVYRSPGGCFIFWALIECFYTFTILIQHLDMLYSQKRHRNLTSYNMVPLTWAKLTNNLFFLYSHGSSV